MIKYLIVSLNKYLEDPEVLLNHRIHIDLNHNKLDWIELFEDFMKECLFTNRFPEFYDINIPSILSSTYFLVPVYKILKLMKEGKEKYIVSNWKFITASSNVEDTFLNKLISDIVNTEYTNNIDIMINK